MNISYIIAFVIIASFIVLTICVLNTTTIDKQTKAGWLTLGGIITVAAVAICTAVGVDLNKTNLRRECRQNQILTINTNLSIEEQTTLLNTICK